VIKKGDLIMINCQFLKFSSEFSDQRIASANRTLGAKVVKRIIAFALYLLGARRRHIAELLKMPNDTLKSSIDRVIQHGITTFEDRRQKTSPFLPSKTTFPREPSVVVEEGNVIFSFGEADSTLSIPVSNTLQAKTILLTLLNNGLITSQRAAEVLDCSTVHTSRLSRALKKGDVYALIDKRQGQKQDYLFLPEIKAELIQQFTANAICGKPTSSSVISEQINKQCKAHFSDRSVRLHMQKLGLPQIAKSLPALIDTLKKNST
jgi:hypothetical protein